MPVILTLSYHLAATGGALVVVLFGASPVVVFNGSATDAGATTVGCGFRGPLRGFCAASPEAVAIAIKIKIGTDLVNFGFMIIPAAVAVY